MIIKIKKGRHSPLILFKRLFSLILFLFKSEYKITYKIKFDKEKSFFQFTGYDVFDYSKLFGFSLGNHQKNESYRFGFRMITEDNIQISLYSYVKGKRYIEKLCDVDYDKDYLFEILYIKKDKIIYYKIQDLTDNNKIIVDTFEKIVNYKFWGYDLFPYIGGNNPAPKNIEFYMVKE